MADPKVGPLLLVILIVVPLFLGGAIQPAAANSCPDSDARSIQFHDGHWWILVSSGDDAPAEVYQFTRDWTVVDRYQIGFEINQTSNETNAWVYRFTSLARTPDEGWWVLANRGTVYRFTNDWNYTGEKQTLSVLDYDAYDIARVNGSWWLLGRDGVWQYTDAWTDPTARNLKSHTGFPTLGLAGSGDNVWTVDSDGSFLSGGAVNRFTPTTGSENRFDHDRRRVLDWEASRPTDIATGPDGNWLVLEDDGGVVPYTDYWQYTGTQQEVTEAIGYCGLSLAPFAYFGFGVLIIALVLIGLFLAWRRYQPRTQHVALITGGAGAVIAIVYGFYLLSPPLSVVYLLPDRLIGAGLIVFFIGTLALVRAAEESTLSWDTGLRDLVASLRGPRLLRDAVIMCLIQAPVLWLVFAFLV